MPDPLLTFLKSDAPPARIPASAPFRLALALLICLPAASISKALAQAQTSPSATTETASQASPASGLHPALLPAGAEAIARQEAERRSNEAAQAEEDQARQQAEAENRRLAAIKEAEDEKWHIERLCQIRPVMTDAEIATCRRVWQ